MNTNITKPHPGFSHPTHTPQASPRDTPRWFPTREGRDKPAAPPRFDEKAVRFTPPVLARPPIDADADGEDSSPARNAGPRKLFPPCRATMKTKAPHILERDMVLISKHLCLCCAQACSACAVVLCVSVSAAVCMCCGNIQDQLMCCRESVHRTAVYAYTLHCGASLEKRVCVDFRPHRYSYFQRRTQKARPTFLLRLLLFGCSRAG